MPGKPYIRLPLRARDGSVRAYALVDEQDAEQANHRWCLIGRHGYVSRQLPRVNGRTRRTVYLHREILGLVAGDGLEGDHKNGDPLDNRRQNLRIVTKPQNGQNRHNPRATGGTSPYRGVAWCSRLKKWVAKVTIAGRTHYLGSFDDEQEAAAAARAFRLANMSHTIEGEWPCRS